MPVAARSFPGRRSLETVWQGRHVSPNSVAVVVADLRRALGDDARDPRHIETVAKRGYRLIAAPPPVFEAATFSPRERPRHRRRYLAVAIAAAGIVAGSTAWNEHRRADRTITVEPVRNATGDRNYRPLATAMSELLVNRISTFGGVDVYRHAGTGEATRLVIQSKLILWNGIPTLSMTGKDRLGHVVWSGMVMGPPNDLAHKTIVELAGLQKRVP